MPQVHVKFCEAEGQMTSASLGEESHRASTRPTMLWKNYNIGVFLNKKNLNTPSFHSLLMSEKTSPELKGGEK